MCDRVHDLDTWTASRVIHIICVIIGWYSYFQQDSGLYVCFIYFLNTCATLTLIISSGGAGKDPCMKQWGANAGGRQQYRKTKSGLAWEEAGWYVYMMTCNQYVRHGLFMTKAGEHPQNLGVASDASPDVWISGVETVYTVGDPASGIQMSKLQNFTVDWSVFFESYYKYWALLCDRECASCFLWFFYYLSFMPSLNIFKLA